MFFRLGYFWRMARVTALLMHFGRFLPQETRRALPALARLMRPLALTEKRMRKLTDRFQRFGPSYIKLGQFLATRPDMIGSDLALALEHLQDRLTAFPQGLAKRELEKALEAPLDSLFVDFFAAPRRRLHRAGASSADARWQALRGQDFAPSDRSAFFSGSGRFF